MLACARIGAVHNVVFAGFSAESLKDRINDSGCVLLITADGSHRRGSIIPLKKISDEAVAGCPLTRNTIVLKRTGHKVEIQKGRDLWWHNVLKEAAPHCEP